MNKSNKCPKDLGRYFLKATLIFCSTFVLILAFNITISSCVSISSLYEELTTKLRKSFFINSITSDEIYVHDKYFSTLASSIFERLNQLSL